MVHLHRSIPPLAPTLRTSDLAAGTTQTQSGQSFSQELLDVGQQAMRSLFGGGSTAVTANPLNPVMTVSTNSAPASAQPAGVGTAKSDPGTVDPVTMLQQAMAAEGVSSAGITMTYKEQSVLYPGGSYPLRMIQCDFGGGHVTYIDADAMRVNPEIAALDVKWAAEHPKLGV